MSSLLLKDFSSILKDASIGVALENDILQFLHQLMLENHQGGCFVPDVKSFGDRKYITVCMMVCDPV